MTLLKMLSIPSRCLVTSISMRGVKTLSMFEQKTNLEKLKNVDVTFDPVCQDVLNRVKVVTDVSESKEIVRKLFASGEPIGVDMEGIENGRHYTGVVSMVQVCDVKRNITLFRTGVNPALYWEGGLAGLLEAPELRKIMHGSVTDCLATYRDGVKLWNLYDTAVAYKVLDYQLRGTSIFGSPQIGFNSLCKYFGIKENPLKEGFKNILWRMMVNKDGKKGLDKTENLDDNFLLYCAWDVDPLHKLHDLLNVAIAPAYSHLITQVSEIEIIRAIDSKLAKIKRDNLKSMELNNVFLSNLPGTLAPPELYSSLTHIKGHKHIYFSGTSGTANIILDSREEAVLACENFSEWGNKLGSQVKCQLVIEDRKNTEEILENENNKAGDKQELKSPAECKGIVKSLLKEKCPVVIDFIHIPDNNACILELYAGAGSSVKVLITQEMGEIAVLLSSDVVKIVPRLDLGPVHFCLKLLHSLKIKVNNVFEVQTAVKSLDYLEHGQSLFKQEARSIKNISSYLGIPMMATGLATGSTIKLHLCYMAYLHLSQAIPLYFQDLLAELAVLEIEIGSDNNALSFKQKRKAFKARLDGSCLHLRLIGDDKSDVDLENQRKMKGILMTTMISKKITMLKYNTIGKCAIVELEHGEAVRVIMKEIEKLEESRNLKLKASHPIVLQPRIDKPSVPEVNLRNLQGILEKNLEKLKLGNIMDNHR